MGKSLHKLCGSGRSLLELGGNAIIVTPDADIKMTVIGAVFEL
jgi:aldehyde dehydrogenase (NAD+)